MTDAYPLAWPDGWPRTPPGRREDGRGRFGKMEIVNGRTWATKRPLTLSEARDGLVLEIERMGGRNIIVSTNIPVGVKGGFQDKGRRPDDEGVAVYFTRKGHPMVMARDSFTRSEENMRSLALALAGLRQMETHGGAVMTEKAFSGFTALPAPKRPHEILGVSADADETTIRRAWRAKIAQAHPDQSGSDAAAAEVNAARDAMLKAVETK